MVDESSPLLPPAEESIEAKMATALEPVSELGEPDFVCACHRLWRSACRGLSLYKEHEGGRYCVLHYPGKEKSADFKPVLDSKLNKKDFDFRGVWFPDEVHFTGFEFSAAADFSDATFSAAAGFTSATFSEAADFSDATFSAAAGFTSARFSADADFISATFSAAAGFTSATFSAAANFRSATFGAAAFFISATFTAAAKFGFTTFSAAADFSAATFSAYAEFGSARFSADADFRSATFSANALFTSASFSADVYFSHATFNANTDFTHAKFSVGAYFSRSLFHARVSFFEATFDGAVQFLGSATERELQDGPRLAAMAFGNNPSLDFQHVVAEHSDRITFHILTLRPHWFVNTDCRLFGFIDVDWDWERISINQEIAALEAKKVESPNRLLTIACRQLAENAETNGRYEEASRFRYWAMDLARSTKWNGWTFRKTDWLHMLYWAVSGYGERILRALGVLFAVWFVFVLLYTKVGFVQQQMSNPIPSSPSTAMVNAEDKMGQPLAFSRALTYSLAVMSLQKPEPKPLTGTAQTLVLLETILGPVQAALLALAIRRKFMR